MKVSFIPTITFLGLILVLIPQYFIRKTNSNKHVIRCRATVDISLLCDRSILLGWQETFCVFFKFSWNSQESSRSFHTKGIYRGYEYLSNNKKTMDMDIDLELEMKISRRELRVEV